MDQREKCPYRAFLQALNFNRKIGYFAEDAEER